MRAVGALVLLGTLIAVGSARAHVGHVIMRAERYLKLDVSGNDARVVVSLSLGEEEGRRVLAAADADGDGGVDALEADAYLAQWGAGLETELPVTVDARPVELVWGEGYFEPIGAVRRTPVTVEMIARFRIDGQQTVRLEDRMVRREVFDRTDVAFRASGGAHIVSSGVEGGSDEASMDLAYPGTFRADEDSIPLVAVVSTPPIARPPPWSGPAVFAAGLLALGALARVARPR